MTCSVDAALCGNRPNCEGVVSEAYLYGDTSVMTGAYHVKLTMVKGILNTGVGHQGHVA